MADDLVGAHRLGAPIQRAGLGLKTELIDRQKLMAKFTLGLMYDLSGLPDRVLTMLTTDADLARWPDDPSKAVLLLFIGRQHLYLRQTDDARRAFEEALQRDPDYLRAHLGLGDAHYQRVALLPADQRLDSPELDQAIGEYQFVFERAPQKGICFVAGPFRPGVVNGELMSWDMRTVPNGQYMLRVVVVGQNGAIFRQIARIRITIAN